MLLWFDMRRQLARKVPSYIVVTQFVCGSAEINMRLICFYFIFIFDYIHKSIEDIINTRILCSLCLTIVVCA